jgi:uncharacterized membrane protein (UPF0127 family)
MVHSRKKNLPKNLILIVSSALIIILGLTLFLFFKPKNNKFPDNISLFINNQGYYLEVAQTSKTRQTGLSNRNNLCFNCGMLFVFNRLDKQTFWMKDTHIPLDIIWLNSKHEIIKIVVAAKTDSENLYTSETPAKYAIELNANESLKLGLKIGDTIEIPNF